MPEVMPNGVTRLDNIKKELPDVKNSDQLTKALTDYNKKAEEFVSYQKSIQDEIELLRNTGASKHDLKEYIDSVTPLFDKRASVFESEIEKTKKNLHQVFENTEFDSIKEQKKFQELLDKLDTQFDVEQENVVKQNEMFSGMLENLSGIAQTSSIQTVDALLGPLKLITDPLGDLMGINFAESIVGGIGSLFSKQEKDEEKVMPKRSKLLREGIEGSAAVYIVDKLGDQEDEEGVMDELFSNLDVGDMAIAGTSLASILGKAIPILAIAASIVWAVIDAITAVGMAEEWGVSKASAGIAGFFAGTGSGWQGAFSNAGKWALMGAGVGFLVGGPVGAIAGGLIGGAIGGILGFIGGENIAKGIEGIGQWFTDRWNDITGFFTGIFGEGGPLDDVWNLIVGAFTTVWDFITAPFKGLFKGLMKSIDAIIGIWSDEETSLFDKITGTIWEVIMIIPNLIGGLLGGLFEGIGNLFLDIFVGQKDAEGKRTKKSLLNMAVDALMDIGLAAIEWLGGIFTAIWEGAVGIVSNVGKFIDEWIIQPVAGFFTRLFTDPMSLLKDIGGVINTWLIEPIGRFFGELFSDPMGALKDIGQTIYDWLIAPLEKPFRWLAAQASKVLDIGLFATEEQTLAYESLAVAGIDMGQFLSAVQQELYDPSSEISRELGGPMADRINILNRENVDLLAQAMVDQGTSKQQSAAALMGMGFSLSEIESILLPLYEERLRRGEIQNFAEEFLGINNEESVEDAIIKADGTIIRTSPDDHIIATKTEPSVMDKEVVSPDLMYADDMAESDSKMLEALYDIATILREKNFSNVVQNVMTGSNMNFDNLRYEGA